MAKPRAPTHARRALNTRRGRGRKTKGALRREEILPRTSGTLCLWKPGPGTGFIAMAVPARLRRCSDEVLEALAQDLGHLLSNGEAPCKVGSYGVAEWAAMPLVVDTEYDHRDDFWFDEEFETLGIRDRVRAIIEGKEESLGIPPDQMRAFFNARWDEWLEFLTIGIVHARDPTPESLGLAREGPPAR